jgi:hypothetical protein
MNNYIATSLAYADIHPQAAYFFDLFCLYNFKKLNSLKSSYKNIDSEILKLE